jgi:hypothetical protein
MGFENLSDQKACSPGLSHAQLVQCNVLATETELTFVPQARDFYNTFGGVHENEIR